MCAGASTSQPSPPGSPPAPAQTISPAAVSSSSRRALVAGHPAGQRQRLQRGGRHRRPGELLDRVVHRVRPGRPPAPAGSRPLTARRPPGPLARVLPGGQERAQRPPAGRARPPCGAWPGSGAAAAAAPRRRTIRRPARRARNSPSLTRPCAASRRSAPVTTACPRPYRPATSAVVNGPWQRAYRATRSSSGSGTGSVNAAGTPTGSGTPSASRSRPASSIAAQRASPLIRTSIARRCAASSASQPGRRAGLGAAAGDLGRRQRPDGAQQVRDRLQVAAGAARGQPLQFVLRLVDDLGIEQFPQVRLAEQLGQQRGVERQRLGAALGERRVALVHERADVAEQQRLAERGRGRRLHLDQPDLAAGQVAHEAGQRGDVEHVLHALPDGLQHDREGAVPGRHREQVRGPLPLLPERGAPAGLAARQQQRPGGALAEPGREQRRAAQLGGDQRLQLVRVELGDAGRRRLVGVGHPQHDPVVGVQGLHVHVRRSARAAGPRWPAPTARAPAPRTGCAGPAASPRARPGTAPSPASGRRAGSRWPPAAPPGSGSGSPPPARPGPRRAASPWPPPRPPRRARGRTRRARGRARPAGRARRRARTAACPAGPGRGRRAPGRR